ncbi:hypothetical protein E4Q23_05070 [Candidatus Accumulibacter phosphatis]|uniref:Uncharacterized protein n=1 Tax=Candidatus Accumulibacter phosphatis TaxID=327160 RepID=A0ABX1TSJ3_9PROT|nr:hypothetical protein [Candidatus Accumulibacter phosphatis]
MPREPCRRREQPRTTPRQRRSRQPRCCARPPTRHWSSAGRHVSGPDTAAASARRDRPGLLGRRAARRPRPRAPVRQRSDRPRGDRNPSCRRKKSLPPRRYR